MNTQELLSQALSNMQAEWDGMPEGFLRTEAQTTRMQQLSRAMTATEKALAELDEEQL